MTPEEKKALSNIKNEMHNYPEMMMITVSRKDLELVVKSIEKATDRRQA